MIVKWLVISSFHRKHIYWILKHSEQKKVVPEHILAAKYAIYLNVKDILVSGLISDFMVPLEMPACRATVTMPNKTEK